MTPNTTPQPDIMSAEDFAYILFCDSCADYESDEPTSSKEEWMNFYESSKQIERIKQRDAIIRAQAIDETLELVELLSWSLRFGIFSHPWDVNIENLHKENLDRASALIAKYKGESK